MGFAAFDPDRQAGDGNAEGDNHGASHEARACLFAASVPDPEPPLPLPAPLLVNPVFVLRIVTPKINEVNCNIPPIVQLAL